MQMCEDLEKDNVMYAEIRTTPKVWTINMLFQAPGPLSMTLLLSVVPLS
jgi:hypothetical protein